MKTTVNKEEVLFYIESSKVVVAVLDKVEDLLFGVQIFPPSGKRWCRPAEDVVAAYKNGQVDFTNNCDLLD